MNDLEEKTPGFYLMLVSVDQFLLFLLVVSRLLVYECTACLFPLAVCWKLVQDPLKKDIFNLSKIFFLCFVSNLARITRCGTFPLILLIVQILSNIS